MITALNKDIIKRSFSRAAATYDASSELQREVAQELIKLLYYGKRTASECDLSTGINFHLPKDRTSFSPAGREPYLALDIGCGTGIFTNSLRDTYPGANFFGCDFSLHMLLKAKEKLQSGRATAKLKTDHTNRLQKNIAKKTKSCAFAVQKKDVGLLASDCNDLPFKDSVFDLVVSNLAYQWVPDIVNAFQEAWGVIKPGGFFVFSAIGPLTLQELKMSYKKAEGASGKNRFPAFLKFHEAENLSIFLKKAGFETLTVEHVLMKKQYKNLWELLKILQATGASPPFSNGKKSIAKGLALKKTAKIYQKDFSTADGNGILTTYDIVFVTAKKN